MTIKEVFRRNEMSVRAYNVCLENELYTLHELKEYLSTNGTFEHLTNCGMKTNRDLINLCNNYNSKNHFYDNRKGLTEEKHKTDELIASELTRVQREVINSFIVVNTNSLSTRNRNVILSLLEENLKVKNFIEKILNKESLNFFNLKNVGSRSVDELNIYVSLIKEKDLSILANRK